MLVRGRRSFKRFFAVFIPIFICGICLNSYARFEEPDGFFVTFEELLQAPFVLQQNDTRLVEHIRANVIINPEDYDVRI